MNHGLMQGMWWAGVLLALVPLLLGAGIGIVVLLHHRAVQRSAMGAAAGTPPAPTGPEASPSDME
ncbi:MAG: hypothetical protein HY703_12665 [Gemmatimonadetes bacterium]|nr:hypothetical protein [Gemmatimonadota bacterium]